MTQLELIAALFGAVSVYLSAREKILSWPTALVNVGLYTAVFFRAKLYADMGLQVIYFVLSAYGWYQWKFGGDRRSELKVSRATRRLWLRLGGVNLAAWISLAFVLSRFTDAQLPWIDSLLSTTSLCAQLLMTRKVAENWLLWIVVDVVYVPMYVGRGLYATAVLYAVFLVLAVIGWRSWLASWRHEQRAAPTPVVA